MGFLSTKYKIFFSKPTKAIGFILQQDLQQFGKKRKGFQFVPSGVAY